MIDEIIPRVLNNWEKIQPGHCRPTHLIPVLQSRNRTVIFLFDADDRSASPAAVVKVSRSPDNNTRLERSARLSQSVRAMLDPRMQATVPRTALLGRINGLSVIAETAMGGEPIPPRALSSSTTASHIDCRAFAEWLLKFQCETMTGVMQIAEATLRETLFHPLEDYLEPESPRDTVWLEEIGKRVIGLPMRSGWRYGDAHPSNILVQRGTVSGVVDWEGAEPDQWPLLDWFHFAFMYAIECCKKTHPSKKQSDLVDCALRLMIRPPTCGVAYALQNETSRFLSSYGLPSDSFPVLFMTFLLKLWWSGDKATLIRQAFEFLRQSL